MVMNGQDLGDDVSSAEGFHTNEDTSAERSEVICSKSPSRRGRGRRGTLAVRFLGYMLLAPYFILRLLWLYRITDSSYSILILSKKPFLMFFVLIDWSSLRNPYSLYSYD